MAGAAARIAGRALLLLTAAALAAGCGGGAKSDAEAIGAMLKDAAKATANGDGDKACGHLTEDAQRQAVLQLASAGGTGAADCPQLVARAQFLLTPLDKQRIKDLEPADVTVTGASASATLRGDAGQQPGQTMVVPLNLIKAGDEWRISGFGQAAGLPAG